MPVPANGSRRRRRRGDQPRMQRLGSSRRNAAKSVDAEAGGDGEGLGGDVPDAAGQLPQRVWPIGIARRPARCRAWVAVARPLRSAPACMVRFARFVERMRPVGGPALRCRHGRLSPRLTNRLPDAAPHPSAVPSAASTRRRAAAVAWAGGTAGTEDRPSPPPEQGAGSPGQRPGRARMGVRKTPATVARPSRAWPI